MQLIKIIVISTFFSLASCGTEPNSSKISAQGILYSFYFDEIQLDAQTADGKPISGVTLSYNINGDQLTVVDGSGWVPWPAWPHYARTFSDGGVLGDTRTDGTFVEEDVSISRKGALTADKELVLFSNGYVNACGDETRGAWVQLPNFANANGAADAGCRKVIDKETNRGLRTVKLSCTTSFTEAQLQSVIASKQAMCD